MKRYLFSSLLLSLILGLAPLSAAWAKPSDLPADNQIQCPDCGEEKSHGSITIGLDVLTGRISVTVEAAKTAAAPPMAIDTLTPACIEQLLKLVGEVLANRLDNNVGVPADRDRQARRLFQVAEMRTRAGDLSAARTFYQQVHMLTPTSRLGQLAIDRLVQIEERMREASEPSEEPAPKTNPEGAFRRLRERTIPLGLVEVSH